MKQFYKEYRNRYEFKYILMLSACVCITYFVNPVDKVNNHLITMIDVLVSHRDRIQYIGWDTLFSNFWGEWFIFTMPILFTVLCVRVFAEELKSGTYRYVILRISEAKYFRRIIMEFIVTALLIIFISVLIYALVSMLIFPMYPNIQIQSEDDLILNSLLYTCKTVPRVLATIVFVILLAYIFAVLTMDRYLAVIFPFLIEYMVDQKITNVFLYLALDIAMYWVAEYVMRRRAEKI